MPPVPAEAVDGVSLGLPDNGEGREALPGYVEFDAVGIAFNFHGLEFAGCDGLLNLGLTRNAVLAVQVLVVDDLNAQAFGSILPVTPVGIGQIDRGAASWRTPRALPLKASTKSR